MSLLEPIRRAWRRFVVMQRYGWRRRGGRSLVSADAAVVHHCLNCGADYAGNYCPHCGQSATVGRFTFRSAVVQVVASLTNLESGFLRSCLELFYRPGHLMRDYLSGKRAGYQKPLTMLFVLATLHVLMHYLCYQNATMELTQQIDPEAVDGNQTLIQILTMMHDVATYLLSNQAILTLVFILFLTVSNWLVYKLTRFGRRLNLAEHFYIMLFVGCQLLIFNIVEMPINVLTHGEEQAVSFASGYSCLLAIWDFKQLYRTSLLRSVLYFALTSLFALINFIVVLVGAVAIYAYYINPEIRTLLSS